MEDIKNYTIHAYSSEIASLNEQEVNDIETLLTKCVHKLTTRITDINEDEVVIRTQLYDDIFTIIYLRHLNNDYKWVLCSTKKEPSGCVEYKEVELFIDMYNKYF